MAGVDSPREAPTNPYVVGDDVAFDVTPDADDQTIGGDLSVYVTVDVDNTCRFQAALDGEGFTEMRRRKFSAVITERHWNQR